MPDRGPGTYEATLELSHDAPVSSPFRVAMIGHVWGGDTADTGVRGDTGGDTDADADADASDEAKGCGCATSSGTGVGLALTLGLLAVRRRRS